MSVYESFGVTPIINASGSVTRLGGAPLPAAVLEAFAAAAREAVPLDQLQAAASRIIAEETGTEAGLVTAGAASALTLGTAAILTGYDPGRMEKLPHCDGFPHEFVMSREQRNGYDHAVRAAGARLVEVGFHEIVANAGVRRTEAWEYEAAFGPQTAGVLYVFAPDSRPPLAEVVERAHQHNLPVLVDAAGELPPRKNLTAIAASGADLVAFSGGKAIRGPQATGILCGRRELIGAAAVQMLDMDDHPELWEPPVDFIDRRRLSGLPRHGLGRGFKVSKEQIVALLTALRLFSGGHYDELMAACRPRLERIAAALQGSHASCCILDKGDGESYPLLEITLDEKALGRSAFEVCRRLRKGTPPVYAGHGRLAQVDGVSSIASLDFQFDAWGVDMAITGSQKGFMLPAGLGILGVSTKALARVDSARSPRSYFDLRPMREQNARGYFPSTPALSLLFGLDESLTMLLDEGMANVAARHRRFGLGVRAAVSAWGLQQCAVRPEIASNTLTAVMMPDGTDAARVIDIAFRRYGISLGAGLAQLAGKLFRIGHMGDTNALTLAGALAGVEMALLDAGVPVALGAGVGAALHHWRVEE